MKIKQYFLLVLPSDIIILHMKILKKKVKKFKKKKDSDLLLRIKMRQDRT